MDEGGRIINKVEASYGTVQHRIDRLCTFSPLDALNAMYFSNGESPQHESKL